MASSTAIEWTEATWNPMAGCTAVSEGCRNCYAARLAATRLAQVPKYKGLATMKNGRGTWSKEVRRFSDDRLTAPLRWKTPRSVFVASMGDLFHKQVPFGFIDKVYAVMALCPQHTFQVLTKRPRRMAEYTQDPISRMDLIGAQCKQFGGQAWKRSEYWSVAKGKPYEGIAFDWPLPNVWLGTSIEDQKTANERIPELLKCPAAVRFVSCEPLLRPIRPAPWLRNIEDCPHCRGDEDFIMENGCCGCDHTGKIYGFSCIHWVIVGGETGPNARPMDPEWARSIRNQCKAAGVPFFFKKMGGGQPTPADLAIREYPEVLLV